MDHREKPGTAADHSEFLHLTAVRAEHHPVKKKDLFLYHRSKKKGRVKRNKTKILLVIIAFIQTPKNFYFHEYIKTAIS